MFISTQGVKAWLKSLRLHKYNNAFENITYEKMITLTGDNLEKMGKS